LKSNVFTILRQILSAVTVSGEENIAKMNGVFQILRELEKATNEPQEEGVNEDGREND
jgi:hypothetical protein